jgi:hypothetical protein
VKKEQERIGQRLLTSHTIRIRSATTTISLKRIDQLLFRFLSHQLDSNFLLLIVRLRFFFFRILIYNI